MTSLDTLARRAADAVHDSVANLPVSGAPIGAAASAAAAWRMARYAAAGAAAGVAVVAALIVAVPEGGPVTTETSVAASSTTVPPVTTTLPPAATTVPPVTTTLPPIATTVPVAPVVPGATEPTSTTTTTEPDITPPVLKVSSPADGEHFETEIVTFAGITEPGAKVTASGKFAASVASDGSWAVDLVLAPGANGVVFAAADAAGNVSQVRMTVYLDVPKETTTTTKAEKGWEFSAFQQYGSCSEPIPYDEFSGTAKPGSTISVTSSYGSGSTTVNEEGTYWLRVEFPGAPFEATFPVKVKDEFGNKKAFEFVSNYGG